MRRAEEAIVLVGGLGTRLRSVVTDLPKPLAPVAGRPFLAHLLDQLASQGLHRVVLATGYLAEKVEQSIGHRWAGMDIAYSREAEPLGTGGAIRLATRMLQGEGVHLANGDTFLRYDLQALEHVVHANDAMLGVALAKVADVGRYGAVRVSGNRVTSFLEKGGYGPGLINAGSYFLTTSGVENLPVDDDAYSFETRVLLPEAMAGRLAAYQDTRDFIDIGVPDDYALAQQVLGSQP
jgi:D-glycero-alpha-D-manno-heptose 1-phosphate guanylyltransferase